MTVTPRERAAYRVLWRRLAQLVIQALSGEANPAELKPLTVDAKRWIIPTDSNDHAWICTMFVQVASGWCRLSTVRDREAIGPALRLLADHVGDLLNATGGPDAPIAPVASAAVIPLRPRADIDG